MTTTQTAPVTPGQITVFCNARLRLPHDQGPPNFFHMAATCYVAAIVAYHTGESPRLPCTLENVVATALHPDYSRILRLLQKDRMCAEFLRPLARALESTDDQPLAIVMGHVYSSLVGIEVSPGAAERVSLFVG